jgi:hypothetical protein
MISGSLILAGRMLGIAFACGLNLYATVALLGLASRAGWITSLPPGMLGLEHELVIGIAALLYVIEFAFDRVPVLDHVWEAVHTLIRPAAAGMLAILALEGMPLSLRAGGAAAAAAVTLAAHGTKTGLRLIVSTRASEARRRTLLRTMLSILEDLAAVGIAIAALVHPDIAIGVMAASGALLLLGGPRLWRASFLGLRAVIARTRGFFRGRGWRYREGLPSDLRAIIPTEPLGATPPRGAPAAVAGLPRVGEYRNGWLLLTGDGPRFGYRALFRSRLVPLPAIAEIRLRRGLVTDALDIRTSGNGSRPPLTFTIFLLKDGPQPQSAAAELTTEQS